MFKKYINYYNTHRFITNLVLVNVAIVMIPLIILGIISYKFMYMSTTENIDRRIETYFNQMSRSVDDYFESINIISKVILFDDIVLDVLKNDSDLKDNAKVTNVNKFLGRSMQLSDSLEGVYILTNTGKQFGTVSYALSTELLNYIEQNIDEISSSSGIVMASGISDKNVVLAIRRIKFTDSLKPAGIGILLISSDMFLESAKNAYEIAQFKIYLTDANDRLVVATDLKDLSLYNEIIEKNLTGNTIFYNNIKYYVREKTFANSKWRFIAMTTFDEMLKKTDTFRNLFVFSVVLIVVLAIGVTLLFNLSITKQLNMLLEAFNKVSSGNFKTRVENLEGSDFEKLGKGFNKMVSEVRKITVNIFETQGRLYEAEIQKANAEFYGLQSQINSHFLYNTLATIRGMARAKAFVQVDNMITALINMLRYGTDTKSKSVLVKELEHVNSYIEIQKNRTKKLKLITDVDEETLNLTVLRLTIQPIVENSILHGIDGKKMGIIKIKSYIENGNLIIKVMDNGVGMDKERLEKLNQCLKNPFDEENHIGIVNIEKRIKAVYGQNYGLSISSFLNIGTVVKVVLPI